MALMVDTALKHLQRSHAADEPQYFLLLIMIYYYYYSNSYHQRSYR